MASVPSTTRVVLSGNAHIGTLDQALGRIVTPFEGAAVDAVACELGPRRFASSTQRSLKASLPQLSSRFRGIESFVPSLLPSQNYDVEALCNPPPLGTKRTDEEIHEMIEGAVSLETVSIAEAFLAVMRLRLRDAVLPLFPSAVQENADAAMPAYGMEMVAGAVLAHSQSAAFYMIDMPQDEIEAVMEREVPQEELRAYHEKLLHDVFMSERKISTADHLQSLIAKDGLEKVLENEWWREAYWNFEYFINPSKRMVSMRADSRTEPFPNIDRIRYEMREAYMFLRLCEAAHMHHGGIIFAVLGNDHVLPLHRQLSAMDGITTELARQ